MKNIVKSFFVILGMAALVSSATYAFFNDTEVSENNVFKAGGIDLKVDSTAHYNGAICEDGKWVCDEWADDSVLTDVEQGLKKNGNVVAANRSNPDVVLGVPESNGLANDNDDGSVVLGTFFSLGFGGHVTYRFDNLVMNGPGDDIRVYEITGGSSYPEEKALVEVSQDGNTWVSIGTISRDDSIDIGDFEWVKYIRITDDSNPALFNNDGDGYDLDGIEAIHCNIVYEEILGEDCGGSWELTDLGPEHTFFDYADLKPGDYGENTISLHVYDNDAYACAYISVLDFENDLLDPEEEDGDSTSLLGELSGELNFFAWDDTDGDNIWELGETPLFADPFYGPASDMFPRGVFPLGALDTDDTAYLGLEWCFGDMDVDIDNNLINCSGANVDNQTQSDIMTAKIMFYVEQVRHNNDFVCPAPEEFMSPPGDNGPPVGGGSPTGP